MIEALVLIPLLDGFTRPGGTTGWEASAGLSLVSVDIPMLPVFPVLTGGLAVERGLSDWLDLGVRYTTWLGFDHQLGPELQAALVTSDRWALGTVVRPSVRVAGTVQDGVALGGDVATLGALVASHRLDASQWTVSAGPTVQWVLFERLGGVGYVDARPYLATVDLAVEVAWADPWMNALSTRLELAIPTAPDDPLRVLGVRPRWVMAGHFGRR